MEKHYYYHDFEYLSYLDSILRNGILKEDRTGTGTLSVFGAQMRFNLKKGFPLLTTKKVHFRGVFEELMWFIRGQTNANILKDKGVNIWNEWADEDGELGPIYGKQWRSWETIDGDLVDQLQEAMYMLSESPDSRRIIVNAWNVGELDKMALPPCHMMFQFYTRLLSTQERWNIATRANSNDYTPTWGEMGMSNQDADEYMNHDAIPTRGLSCHLYQRSADSFLGVPYNIASYSLLVHMIAQQVQMEPDEFIWAGGDCHIYTNHTQQVMTQLARAPKASPMLRLTKKDRIEDYEWEDVILEGYDPHPAIKAPIAI